MALVWDTECNRPISSLLFNFLETNVGGVDGEIRKKFFELRTSDLNDFFYIQAHSSSPYRSILPRSRTCVGGLLLRHAVQRAQPPDQVDGMDADDFAAGEHVGKNAERNAVVGIMEAGHEDEAIGDVEVCVAGRHALPAKHNRPRQRKIDGCHYGRSNSAATRAGS